MFKSLRHALGANPTWGGITALLLLGVVLVGFGNGDRMLWKLTSTGATLPGVILDVRRYRGADDTYETYVPKVAFRDDSGAVRVMETTGSAIRYNVEVDQPVFVAWDSKKGTVGIDVPFKRHIVTSAILSLLTAIGVTAWLYGIGLIIRRIRVHALRVRETAQDI